VGLVASLVAVMFGQHRTRVQRFAYSQWAASLGLKQRADPMHRWQKNPFHNKMVQHVLAAQHILW
jgi:hypothetical protein